ncbi:hypothetical protein ACIP79_00475 [Streptomyces sp. NPDC088747]|uniref:hypothetical protein n=1 Tax=Streptomyces sp. NPDC088747 TaxID=3365886 RepID=UPI00381E2122
MSLYIAYNCAIDATTGVMAGTSYAANAKVAIQLATPSTTSIRIVEWGVSFSGTAAGAPAICTLAQASAATTSMTAHSTSTVMPIGDSSKASSLTMGTGSTAYGAVAITTNTTERQFGGALVSPMTQYEKQWPLGREPVVSPSKYCQLRINTAATYTAIAYIVFEEC